jgi:hypothetical protein
MIARRWMKRVNYGLVIYSDLSSARPTGVADLGSGKQQDRAAWHNTNIPRVSWK